ERRKVGQKDEQQTPAHGAAIRNPGTARFQTAQETQPQREPGGELKPGKSQVPDTEVVGKVAQQRPGVDAPGEPTSVVDSEHQKDRQTAKLVHRYETRPRGTGHGGGRNAHESPSTG